MSEFVEVTAPDGKKVHLNLDFAHVIREATDDDRKIDGDKIQSVIYLGPENALSVLESIDDILGDDPEIEVEIED